MLEQSYPCYQVWVVDNGSTDGSVNYVKEVFPRVKVIALPENRLFTVGNNVGIKEAFKDQEVAYVALLNNDTIPDKDWLTRMVQVSEQNQRIGICAAKMLQMDDPRFIDSTGHVFDKRGKIIDRGHREIDHGQYDTQPEVIGACAGACLYRRTMLEKIGLFDERLGMYYEDAELSWRAYKRGWQARYVPNAVVYHQRGGSRKADRVRLRQSRLINLRNQITTVKRYGNRLQKFLYGTRLVWKLFRALRREFMFRRDHLGVDGYLLGLRWFLAKGA